jgi:hypothetical protein
MAPPLPLLADLDDMELHRCIQHRHVAQYMPRVGLPRQRVVVPSVDGDPAMQGAGFVGPCEGEPC